MDSKTVRVRFAPSPTGPLHIGGLRTALYNYLFAKQNNGTFILRIEDTDQSRFNPKAEQHILDSLAWCGILPDEGPSTQGLKGPYKQSKRKETYNKYVKKLIDSGDAYLAFDTPKELQLKREEYEQKNKDPFQYDNKTRGCMRNTLSLSEKEIKELLRAETPYVVRIKMPKNKEIVFSDMVRGKIQVNTKTLDDKILLKGDGMPTYHLANVVDDYLMNISHVIRGEEWLPSTPLHILLYEKLGWKNKTPKIAHLPLILKPQGKGKLSKRDGEKMGYSVFPIQWEEKEKIILGFREEGFLPEATTNILALLGWNPGTEQEVFSLKELIKKFSLKKISKGGARFDLAKSKWINQKHIQREPDATLIKYIEDKAKTKGVFVKGVAKKTLPLVKKRAETLVGLWRELQVFYCSPNKYNTKKWNPEAKEYIEKLVFLISSTRDFSAANLKTTTTRFIENKNLSYSTLLVPLRILLLGDSIGPDLFQTIEALGEKETKERIKKGLKVIQE